MSLRIAVALAATIGAGMLVSTGAEARPDMVGFRGEFFPFVALAPRLGDLAAFAQFGVGSTNLQAKGDNYPSAGYAGTRVMKVIG